MDIALGNHCQLVSFLVIVHCKCLLLLVFRYRVFAVDHGLFSFVDKTFDTWPVVLITNPKHAQFNMPHYEPLGRMVRSTHVR